MIFMIKLDNHILALETDHTEFLLLIQITAMVKNSIKNHGMNQSMEDPKKVESGTMMELITIQWTQELEIQSQHKLLKFFLIRISPKKKMNNGTAHKEVDTIMQISQSPILFIHMRHIIQLLELLKLEISGIRLNMVDLNWRMSTMMLDIIRILFIQNAKVTHKYHQIQTSFTLPKKTMVGIHHNTVDLNWRMLTMMLDTIRIAFIHKDWPKMETNGTLLNMVDQSLKM